MVSTAPHRVGSYLSRSVRCAGIDDAADFGELDVDGMLVLLHTGDSLLSAEEKKELAKQVVRRRPLSMFFTGTDAEEMFNILLRALDAPTFPLPMMTKFSTAPLVEALDEFLSATWPPDERWDEWRGYLLVNIGGTGAAIAEAASPLVDG